VAVFYDFLKIASEKSSAFDFFSDSVDCIDQSNLTVSQLVALNSKDAMQISKQIVLEQNDLPSDAAISITVAVSISISRVPNLNQ
jgi:hypothetical protein